MRTWARRMAVVFVIGGGLLPCIAYAQGKDSGRTVTPVSLGLSSSRQYPAGMADVRGLSLGFLNNADYSVTGIQVSLGSNETKDTAYGLQIAGLANGASNTAGLQVSGLANFSKNTAGLQVAGLLNLNANIDFSGKRSGTYAIDGIQISGLINVTDNMEGMQMAGLLNRVRIIRGVQTAAWNNGTDVSGGQCGVANFAEEIQGLQIGLVNWSKNARGIQLGVVNRAEELKGLQVGLLNFKADRFIPIVMIGW